MFRTLAENVPGGPGRAAAPARRAPHQPTAKTLAAILAEARDAGSGATFPAIIHRRYGRGEVLSVAVEGLWRWSFNPKTTATNNLFDRFWDQLLVWLVAGGDITPSHALLLPREHGQPALGENVHAAPGLARPHQDAP